MRVLGVVTVGNTIIVLFFILEAAFSDKHIVYFDYHGFQKYAIVQNLTESIGCAKDKYIYIYIYGNQ